MSRVRFQLCLWGSLGEPPEEGPEETVRGGLECGACGGRQGLALGAMWRRELGGGRGLGGVLGCRAAAGVQGGGRGEEWEALESGVLPTPSAGGLSEARWQERGSQEG